MGETAILIVEDEVIVAESIRSTLASFGYPESEIATSGEEAIELAESMRPGLVLMDIHLSGSIDGVEAVSRIRAIRSIPVVYLTAHSDDETLRRAAAAGAHGYVVKPFDEVSLRVAVEVALAKHAVDERLARAEERIHEGEKHNGLIAMAGGIAHDLNNTLAAILGNAELALDEVPPESPAGKSLAEIARAAQRGADLSRRLCAYSGGSILALTPIDLASLAASSEISIKSSISERIALSVRAVAGTPSVRGDRELLSQAMANLIENAVEAIGEEQGTITVTTGIIEADAAYLAECHTHEDLPEGDYAYVAVSDTGPGISAELTRKVFEPFFTTKFAGRGLGLSVVCGIARSHGGAVRLESTATGGPTFVLLLPMMQAPSVVPEEAPPAAQGTPTAVSEPGRTVLIVDDEAMIRGVARKCLERAGLTVLVATSGREGIEEFGKHRDQIGVVLLDLTMPDMGGGAVLRRIRRIDPEARIVLSSGYAEEQAREMLTGVEPTSFLGKPYRPTQLVEAVRAAMSV